MRSLSAFLCVGALILVSTVSARTWYITSDGTGDAPTIHAGIDSASAGDTVKVAPGTYLETDDPETWIHPRPGVSLVGEEGPEATIIEVCGTGSGINLYQCECVRISGFTVRYGDEPGCVPGMGWPSGIIVHDCADVIVENCIVHAPAYGIELRGTVTGPDKPIIRNNTISNCSYGLWCGDNYATHTPLLQGNVITDCSFGISVYLSSPRIIGNIVTYCRFVGIHFGGNSESICTRNVVAYCGSIGGESQHGGVWVSGAGPGKTPTFNELCEPEMANDFYGNTGCDIGIYPAEGPATVDANCNYWGSNCPDFTGRFVGTVLHDIWVDSAHSSLLSYCPKGTESTTWGAVKALYR